jgi:outer membrane lipoprotein-sorting protein
MKKSFYLSYFFLITSLVFPKLVYSSTPAPASILSKQAQDVLMEQLKQKANLQSLSGIIHFTVTRKNQTQSLEAAFILEAPNKLHLEIIDDLGQTQMRIIANGKNVLWWDAEKNNHQILDQNEKVLKKIFKLPLSVSDLVEALLSQESMLELKKIYTDPDFPEQIYLQFSQKLTRLHQNNLTRDQVTFFKKKNLKKPLYQIHYQWNAARPKEQAFPQQELFPEKLTWNFYKPKVRVELEFKNMTLNPKITEEKFDFSRW